MWNLSSSKIWTPINCDLLMEYFFEWAMPTYWIAYASIRLCLSYCLIKSYPDRWSECRYSAWCVGFGILICLRCRHVLHVSWWRLSDQCWLMLRYLEMCRGPLAERLNLRWFLSFGMISSGLFGALFGVAYYADIHSLTYFIAIQVLLPWRSSVS